MLKGTKFNFKKGVLTVIPKGGRGLPDNQLKMHKLGWDEILTYFIVASHCFRFCQWTVGTWCRY
jgi:hypothetical protein